MPDLQLSPPHSRDSYEQTAEVLPLSRNAAFQRHEEQEGQEWGSQGSDPFLTLEANPGTILAQTCFQPGRHI